MKLTELTTPYERRYVFEYGADKQKAVRACHEVRQVAGPLFMTRPVKDEWGNLRFDLCLFYPDVPDGAIYLNDMNRPDLYEAENLLRGVQEMGVETKEDIVRLADRKMKDGGRIGEAAVGFILQWAPDKAAELKRYRKNATRISSCH